MAIQVALIGYGFSGKTFHLPFLIQSKSYEVKYILTNNQNSIREINQLYPAIQVISVLETALSDADIDLVIIATPNDVHGVYTKSSLLAGKHVLVEKPFVETYQEAKSLFSLAKAQRKQLTVFHNRQYDGDIITVEELLLKDILGKIKNVKIRFDRYAPNVQQRWREQPGLMAGVFYDLAPHLVHHMVRLFGIPQSVYLQLFNELPNALVDDHFELIFQYADFTCFLGSSKLERQKPLRFELVGSEQSYYKYGYDEPDQAFQVLPTYQVMTDSYLLDYNQQETILPVYQGKHYLFFDQLAKDISRNSKHDKQENISLAVVGLMELAVKSFDLRKEIQVSRRLKNLHQGVIK